MRRGPAAGSALWMVTLPRLSGWHCQKQLCEPCVAMQRGARPAHRRRHHEKLQIRSPRISVFGAERTTDLPRPNSQRTARTEHPLQGHFRQFQRVEHVLVQRGPGIRHLHNRAHLNVVLQVLTHFGGYMAHSYALCGSNLLGSDTGKLQDLRRSHRPCAQQNLPIGSHRVKQSALPVRDTYCAVTLKQQARPLRMGFHRQIGLRARRAQKRGCRTFSPAPAQCQVIASNARCSGLVEVIAVRQPLWRAALSQSRLQIRINQGASTSDPLSASRRCGACRTDRQHLGDA